MWAVVACVVLCTTVMVEPCASFPLVVPSAALDPLDSVAVHSADSRAYGEREHLVAASSMHCCWSRLGLQLPGTSGNALAAAARVPLKSDDKAPVDGAVGRHCSPDTCQHCHTAHNCNRHKKYCRWHEIDPNHPKEGICVQRPEHEL